MPHRPLRIARSRGGIGILGVSEGTAFPAGLFGIRRTPATLLDLLQVALIIFGAPMSRSVVKYVLLQLPALALVAGVLFLLRRWIAIPLWLVVLLILLWAAKDALLYPLERGAFAGGEQSGMIGRRGRAKERLAPRGTIELDGALWSAETRRGGPPIGEGELVEVTAVHGLTLIVERAGPGPGPA